MELRELVVMVAALVTGYLIQNIIRWKPLWNVGVTFLGILILPPTWSIGLTAGLWLGCAFMTYRPQSGYQNEIPRGLVWTFIYAVFTFSGFILTLLLMWKVKAYSGLPLVFRHEVGAWLYFATIEVCFYRIIARNYPKRKRFVIGYQIGFFNMLMALYWVYSYGLEIITLTFMTLLVINPLLLLWFDRPLPTRGIPLGGDR